MKNIILIFLLLPCFVQAQNYLFEIEYVGNGNHTLEWTDDPNEAYPRKKTDFGPMDTAQLQLTVYQHLEGVLNRQAAIMARSFASQLNAEQTTEAVGAIIPLNYQAWINGNLAGVYDGVWTYRVRGTATNLPVVITGGDVRRQSDNVLIATLSARANNWLRVTVQGSGEIINLYQFGADWVGYNAAGQIVTLKK
jgi:hypothetical protein